MMLTPLASEIRDGHALKLLWKKKKALVIDLSQPYALLSSVQSEQIASRIRTKCRNGTV